MDPQTTDHAREIEMLRSEVAWLTTENERLKSVLKHTTQAPADNRLEPLYKDLYKSIVETANEGIWVTDLNGFTMFINEQLTTMLGYTAEEMAGKEAAFFMDSTETEVAKINLRKRINGEKENFTRKYVRKNGTSFWAMVSATSIADAQGNIIALMGMLTDVTREREAHESLKLSEQLFSVAFKDNPVALALSHMDDGTIIEINKAYLELLGWSREELLGQSSLNLGIWGNPKTRQNIVEEIKVNKELKNFKTTLYTRNSIALDTLINVKVIEYEGKNVLLTNIQDITRLNTVEQSLRLESNKLKAVIENMGVGVVLADTSDNIFTLNKEAMVIHGFKNKDDAQKKLSDYIANFEIYYPNGTLMLPEDWPVARAKRGETVVNCEGTLHNLIDSSIKNIIYNATPVTDEAGTWKLIIITLTDQTLQKKTTESLYESEQRYTGLFNNKTTGIAHCRIIRNEQNQPIDFELMCVNDTYSKITGIEKSQIEGKTAREVLTEIKNFDAYSRITQSGGEFSAEAYYASINKWLNFYAYSYKKDEFTAIISDISEQKETLKKLSLERTLFEGIINTIPVMITIYDPNLAKFTFNKALKETLGWTEEDARDGFFMEKVYPDPALRKEVSEYMQSLEQSWKEFPVKAKNGSFVHSAWANIKLSNGVLIGIGIDIRHRQEAEMKIKEIDVQFRTLADNMYQLAWMAEKEGEIYWYNKRWYEYTGTTPEEVLGWGWKIVQHPDYLDKVYLKYKKAIQAGEYWEDTFPLRSKYGQYNWFLSRAVPIRNEQGDITHWFGTNTDVTLMRNTEEQLRIAKEKAEENDKLKSAFLANMSHEIRTPMTGILGFTELLKTTEITEDQRVFLNIVESNGKRMLNIINDLIDISKIEAHQVEMNFEATDLPKLLNELLVFFVPEANKRNIFLKLKCDLPIGLEKTYTDQTRLSQVLSNLIKNALKFTSQGTVEFGCEPMDNNYKFFVKDTGTGIPPEKIEIIFERFHQGDISWADKSEGVGLGLSISKAYVELMGGKLDVQSEVGTGSLFFFTLPFQSIPVEANPDNNQPLYNLKPVHNKKVLIAEDEEGIFMLLSTILRSQKIETIHACDGKEAIEILKKRDDIDLVLMDSKMPNLTGSEATRIIRTFNTKVPIIALSAYSSEADKIRAINTGCNDYLVKPMTRDGFIEKVMKYL